MDKIEVLKKSDVFRYLDDEDLKVIAAMSTVEEFEPGAILCKQDKEAEKLYVIEEGLVAILLELGPLDQRQLQAASNSDCCVWSAVIPPNIATTTAKALEKTKALAFDGQELRKLIDTNPKLYAKITDGIGFVVKERLKAAFSQLMGVTHQD